MESIAIRSAKYAFALHEAKSPEAVVQRNLQGAFDLATNDERLVIVIRAALLKLDHLIV